MAETIGALGDDATVRGVFDTVFDRVDRVFTDVAQLQSEAEADQTGLRTTSTTVSGRGDGWEYRTRKLRLSRGWGDDVPLVALTRRHWRGSGDGFPHSVGANRGAEYGSDFRLGSVPQERLVEVHLGGQGYWGTGQSAPHDEPLGDELLRPDVRVGWLSDEQGGRLLLVANRILQAVGVVESIALGAKPDDALCELGILRPRR